MHSITVNYKMCMHIIFFFIFGLPQSNPFHKFAHLFDGQYQTMTLPEGVDKEESGW